MEKRKGLLSQRTPNGHTDIATAISPHITRVGLKSDGTTGQTTGHLAARGSASHYMARRKATRQATELTTV